MGIKVKVYFQDVDTGKARGFMESFKNYSELKRYLADRLKWTTFRTLVLIKGDQLED